MPQQRGQSRVRTLTAVAAVGSGVMVGVLSGVAAGSTPGRQPAPASAAQSPDALQVLQLRAPDAVPVAAGQRAAVATTGGS